MNSRRGLVWFALATLVAELVAAAPVPERARDLRVLLDMARAERGMTAFGEPLTLVAVAQELAEAAAAGERREDEDLLGLLGARGYDADSVELVRIGGPGSAERIANEMLLSRSSFRGHVLGSEHTDLGIGFAPADGRPPSWVLLFAVSEEEAFARRIEPLLELDAVRVELLEGANAERQQRGLPGFGGDRCLDQAAQLYAERMLASGFFAHTAPQGDTAIDRIRRAGCNHHRVSENLASGPVTAAGAIAGWMASAEHRETMLVPGFARTGFGVAAGHGPDGAKILWVQIVGR